MSFQKTAPVTTETPVLTQNEKAALAGESHPKVAAGENTIVDEIESATKSLTPKIPDVP